SDIACRCADLDLYAHILHSRASSALMAFGLRLAAHPNGKPSGSRSSLAGMSRSSSSPVMTSPLSVIAKPHSTSPILPGLSTRIASSTHLTWCPSVRVTDCTRLHGAVGPRLNFVPLRPAALSTSPTARYVPCANVLQIPNSGCFTALQHTEAVLSVITPRQPRPVMVASNRRAGIVPCPGCEKDNVTI